MIDPVLEAPAAAPARRAQPLAFRNIRSLTGLRGVAILMVLACHLGFPRWTHTTDLGIGVHIFFVLSGYLITSLLVTEWQARGRVSAARFYGRRAFRLLPAAYAIVLAIGVIAAFSYRITFSWGAALASMFYAGNWYDVAHHGYWLGFLEHTWSLSVEEQFYIVWPALLLLTLRRSPRLTLSLAFAGIAAISLTRGIAYGSLSQIHVYRGTDMNADLLLWGCALSLLMHSDAVSATMLRLGRIAGIVGAAAILAVGFSNTYAFCFRIGLVLVGAGTAAVIASCVNGRGPVNAFLGWSVLVLVGEWSYSLYLWHYPIIQSLRFTTLSLDQLRLVAVILSFAAAAVSYYALERPIRRWGRHWLERKLTNRPRQEWGAAGITHDI